MIPWHKIFKKRPYIGLVMEYDSGTTTCVKRAHIRKSSIHYNWFDNTAKIKSGGESEISSHAWYPINWNGDIEALIQSRGNKFRSKESILAEKWKTTNPEEYSKHRLGVK